MEMTAVGAFLTTVAFFLLDLRSAVTARLGAGDLSRLDEALRFLTVLGLADLAGLGDLVDALRLEDMIMAFENDPTAGLVTGMLMI